MAPRISVVAHTDNPMIGYSGCWVCVWLSCRFVVDLGTCTLIFFVVRSACVVFLRVGDLSDCSDLLHCIPVSG